MNLIILFLGVLSLVYEGDCAITDWTAPVIATASGSGTLTYAESQAAGVTLETLATNTAATDFVITSQPTAGKLAVVQASGVLTLVSGFLFDFETEPTYVIVVTASDGATTETATITVSITDIALDANYDQSTTTFYRIDDAAAASTTVATITASGGTGGTVYSIASGNTGTDFAYSSAGVLTNLNVMARSTTPAYVLTLQAVAASVTSTFNIVVCVGTSDQCGGSGAAGLQISLVVLLVAIVTSRIK